MSGKFKSGHLEIFRDHQLTLVNQENCH